LCQTDVEHYADNRHQFDRQYQIIVLPLNPSVIFQVSVCLTHFLVNKALHLGVLQTFSYLILLNLFKKTYTVAISSFLHL